MRKSPKKGYTLYVLLAVCIILVGGLGYKMLRPQKTIQRENRNSVFKLEGCGNLRPQKSISKTARNPSERVKNKNTSRNKAASPKQTNAKDTLKNRQPPTTKKSSEKQKTREEEAIKKMKEGNKGMDLYNKDSQGESNPKDKQEVNI